MIAILNHPVRAMGKTIGESTGCTLCRTAPHWSTHGSHCVPAWWFNRSCMTSVFTPVLEQCSAWGDARSHDLPCSTTEWINDQCMDSLSPCCSNRGNQRSVPQLIELHCSWTRGFKRNWTHHLLIDMYCAFDLLIHLLIHPVHDFLRSKAKD